MDALDRTFQPTRRVLGDVDPAQPLDLTHSLLDGLEAFWLPLPSTTGGERLYDLTGLYDAAISGPNWTTFNKSRFPVLDFDGGNDYVEVKQNPAPEIGSPYTVLSGFLVSSTNRYNIFNASKSAGDRHGFTARSGRLEYGIFNGSSYVVAKSTSINANEYIVAVATYDGVDGRLFVDNKEASGSSSPLLGPSAFVLGADANLTDRNLNGVLGPFGFWRREFSVDEVWDITDQARRGFPDLLNRRSDVGLLGGGGGGTADTVSFDTATALADGFAPTITATPSTVTLGTAQAAAEGFSATVTATQNSVSVGTAQATAQGFAPTITTGSNTIAATTGQAGAQGFDPTISEGAAGDTITADLGTAQAQGFAPSISSNPATVTLGLGQAAAKGFAPDVVADSSEINTGQGQAAATGFDPTITKSARTVAPQPGTAQAQGFEPAVVDGTVGVATTMEIEARPLHEIDVEAKPLYRIRLFVKEQLP